MKEVHTVFNASKWSLLTEICVKIVPPLALVVLARVLTPSDYGVVTIAGIVISFVQIFCDFGLSKSIIQREYTGDALFEAIDTAFWINAAVGLAIFLLIFFFSGTLGSILGNKGASNVIKALSFNILAYSLSALQTGYAQRKLNFRNIFWVRFATSILPYLISIPMAFSGYGYWALVGGNIVGAYSGAGILWLLSDWKPKLRFNRRYAKDMLGFGLWNAAEGLAGWGILWVDSLIITFYFSTGELGLYRTAANFTDLVTLLVTSPILPVLFSFLSRNQNNRDKFNRYFLEVHKFVCFVTFAMGILLFFYGRLIQEIVFGNRWAGIASLIGILGIGKGFIRFFNLNGEAYRALGKASYNTIVMLVSTSLYIPFLLWSASTKNLTMFALTKTLICFVQVPFHAVALQKTTGIKFSETLRNLKSVFFASLMMVGCCLIIGFFRATSVYWDILRAIIALLAYVIVIAVIDRAFLAKMILYGNKVLSSNRLDLT